nr:PKD domain-containing protein [Chitinophagaceae bacterium]
MKQLSVLLILLFGCKINHCFSQITFQKQYSQPDSASSFEAFDAKATPDGGYVMSGLASDGPSGSLFHPFIAKVNCKGELQWQHYFGNSQSIGNVNGKVIVTHDSGYVMINNLGVYNNYNGFAVRIDKNGSIVWQKLLNLSNGNDNINDIQETADGSFIISGSVKSTPDVGLIKLSANGDLIWCKTFGNNAQYDDGTALIETNDGGYLVTGRYISMGTFNAFLMKTDSSGAMQWLKCYGDTNQHMWGFDVKELDNGDFVLVGSTTLLKPNFQSFGDNFIMRLNSVGDTIWTKIFYGSPDLFENASTVLVDDSGNFVVGVATASYPTPGNVPNKHAIMKFSPTGTLISARTYNDGNSHYTRISKATDGGYLLNGFSNKYTGPVGFQTLLMKLDNTLSSGCFESDVTALTVVQDKGFKITQPGAVLGTSGTVVNNTTTYSTAAADSTICESYPVLSATIDTSGFCAGDSVFFSADSVGISSWHWNFGDPGASNDTSSNQHTSYVYGAAGTYTVTLTVSNGCDSVTNTMVVSIKHCNPESVVELSNEDLELLVYPNPAKDYVILESELFTNTETEIAMFDMYGQKVFAQKVKPDAPAAIKGKGRITLDVSLLSKGMYLLTVGEYVRRVVLE